MSRRSDWVANVVAGALFLTGVCLVLPVILFGYVATVVAVGPVTPLV